MGQHLMRNKGLQGDKLYQKKARLALPILVRQAQAGKTIYYSDLASEIGYSNARNLAYPLGTIGHELKKLSEEWGEDIPAIQCIVINKSKGLPGKGLDWFISDKELSHNKKKVAVNRMLSKIYTYNKWDNVLKEFDLEALLISENVNKIIKAAAKKRGRGIGGEGIQHKKLKEYIKNNPKSVGVKSKKISSRIEEPLPSGDSIDVYFENKKELIGVEVKSEISSKEDITRGLYQCIKYLAVMEAYNSVNGSNLNKIRVILALAGMFPKELEPLKNTLGVQVIDNISYNSL